MIKTRITLGATVVVLLSGSASFAQAAKTPFTLADARRLASVAEPAFSPDGNRVIYSVTQDDLEKDVQVSDLWVVDWSSGAPRQLTSTPTISEWQPEYSRDGRWIAFLSDSG